MDREVLRIKYATLEVEIMVLEARRDVTSEFTMNQDLVIETKVLTNQIKTLTEHSKRMRDKLYKGV